MCECTQACVCPCAFGFLPSTKKALVTGSLECYSYGQAHALLDHLPLENNNTGLAHTEMPSSLTFLLRRPSVVGCVESDTRHVSARKD